MKYSTKASFFTNLRIMRPTNKYQEVTDFYVKGLGLKILNEFSNHDGYDGRMIGLPNEEYHLEIIYRHTDEPNVCLDKDNGLVFFCENEASYIEIVNRLKSMGYPTCPAKNPWWNNHKGAHIEDPDGWPVIFYPTNQEVDF